ncbi:prepilin peptidase [Marinomonas ostreistagni]|uniref:Prepilin leader peptidase/N-methyltransferase n=1 Tax=Marinomonas ostreistagni TaxID=359209 RepID=A0ABS0ZE74_9GAMM|nr:A24 family peptidase [Marinomonas ostreistagni]MBJ7551964.1 prepilin peptidase [Marinomonas ostreistagni]
MDYNLIIYVIALLCLGSTLSALTYRWNLVAQYSWRAEAHEFIELPFYEPKPLSFFKGRSCCPKCDHRLHFTDLIPLFSFLRLKGRCRHCHGSISFRYPLIELMTCAALLPLYWLATSQTEWLILGLLITSLICATVIDAEHLWLPDECTFVVFCCASYLFFIAGEQNVLPNIFIGIFAYLSVYGLRLLFLTLRGIEAIGLGDAKLLAALTYWLGPASYSSILFFASALGLLWALITLKNKATKIPFGPFLIFSAISYFYLGHML